MTGPRTIFAALAALAAAGASAQAPQPNFATATAISGVWSYRSVAGGTEAVFTDTAAIRRLVVRCVPAHRQVALSMTSNAPVQSLSVWTSTATRSLPARFDQQTYQVIATLAPEDPLLDAIAFSRGRFVLMIAGSPALVVQPQPEVERAIEDCRN